MRRLWITLLVLALGASTAVAQRAPAGATLAATTDAAEAQLAKDHRDRTALVAKKATLAKRYEGELAAVDRLKQQRTSWRRARQLEDAQAKALDTSQELAALSGKIAALDAAIAKHERAVVAAIDAELPTLAAGTRKQTLTQHRAAAAPPVVAKARKIVVPDAQIDPLADPEELDLQADSLRTSEAELQKQVDALDAQAKRLEKAVELRKAHDRAGDLAVRDDDGPRHGGTSGGRNAADITDNPAPTDPQSGGDAPPPMGELGGFAGEETARVLSDVIDPATGDELRRAGRATDPATKAQAAKRARDEVAARLAALRKQRAAIEARARELRQ